MARFEPGRTTARPLAVCLNASFPALNVLFANRLSTMTSIAQKCRFDELYAAFGYSTFSSSAPSSIPLSPTHTGHVA